MPFLYSNIQNQIRAYASKRTEAGEFENDDASVVKFATALRVTVGKGSELRQEMEKQISAMPSAEQVELKRLLAKHEAMQKTAKATIAAKKEKAQ